MPPASIKLCSSPRWPQSIAKLSMVSRSVEACNAVPQRFPEADSEGEGACNPYALGAEDRARASIFIAAFLPINFRQQGTNRDLPCVDANRRPQRSSSL